MTGVEKREEDRAGFSRKRKACNYVWLLLALAGLSAFPFLAAPGRAVLHVLGFSALILLLLRRLSGARAWLPCAGSGNRELLARLRETIKTERILLNGFLENVMDKVYFKDRNSRFIRASRSTAEFHGLSSPEELLGKSDFDLMDEEIARKYFEAEQTIMHSGKPVLFREEAGVVREGVLIRHLTSKLPLRDERGEVIGLAGIARDITEWKLAEEASGYWSDLLQAMLDNVPDLLYFKDREHRFIKCSASVARRLAAEDADDLIGKTDRDFFSPADAAEAHALEKRIMETGQPVLGRLSHKTYPDGSRPWCLGVKMPLRNRKGEIMGTFGITKDITELKQAEEQLKKTHAELLEASHMAGRAEVATGLLHNIGNVLNSVNVSADLAIQNVRQSKAANLAKILDLIREHEADLGAYLTADEKGRKIPAYLEGLSGRLLAEREKLLAELDSLKENLMHIREVIETQQDYARRGRIVEEADLRDLMEDALKINAAALARHDVRLVREYQNVSPLHTDRSKVLHILVNLVGNAKYALDGQTFEERVLTVKIEPGGPGRARVTVGDNGEGIAPENLPRIFEHGFTTRKDGHGFGLHSSALSAKELGGSLTARSTGPGQGASFILDLPLTRKIPS